MRRLTVIVILAMACVSAGAQQDANETALVEKIELLGGKIERDESLPDRPVIGVSFARSTRFSEKYLHLLAGFGRLRTIELGDVQITENGLKSISNPKLLFNLLTGADEARFDNIFAAFRELGETGIEILKTELDQTHFPVERPPSDPLRESVANRTVNTALALLRMEQPDRIWPLLRHSPDPRIRSELIHRIAHSQVDPQLLIDQLRREADVTVRRAITLTLGEFPDSALTPLNREEILSLAQDTYQTEGDPGLHAAAEWLLVHWKQFDWLTQKQHGWSSDDVRQQKLAEIQQGVQEGSRAPRWYVNSQEQTMVVIPGSVEFAMGSPETERLRVHDERPHRRRIDRTFAVAAKPVTLDQFRHFDRQHREGFNDELDRRGELPAVRISWITGARYCNWLSEREHLEPCFEFDGDEIALRPNYLSLSGYRFPTEAEIEYASRAGAITSRFFGQTDNLMPYYAWFQKSLQKRIQPVGLLKPNDLGLFDSLGNVSTWCLEGYAPYPIGPNPALDVEDPVLQVKIERSRVLRGGSITSPSPLIRCACRDDLIPGLGAEHIGLRLARTVLSSRR